MAKVEVVSSSLVPMASVDVTPMSRLDLTPWDLQMLLLEPIQYGILFHKPAFPIEFIIDYLKASLSRVLDYFPPLAGRLSTDNINDKTAVYFVDCNNKGAGFIHAAATDVSVSYITEATHTPEIVFSFFPLNGTRNFQGTSEPLFAIQITQLEDGLFMGCTANHAVVDGSSLWHLIRSWSEIGSGREKISEMPSFERDFPGWENRPIPVRVLELNFTTKIVRPPLLERVFRISKESVAKLKARANLEAGEFTSFQVILGHIWRCVARSRKKTDGNSEEVFVTAIGARGKIPLPKGYFGNAIDVSWLCMSEGEVLGDGLGLAALGLKAFFAGKGKEEVVLGFLEEWVKEPQFHVHVEGSFTLGVTSFPKFDAYGGMGNVGLGKPVAVRSGKAQKWDGSVTIFMADERDGFDVEVCLAPEVMAALEEDVEFIGSHLI